MGKTLEKLKHFRNEKLLKISVHVVRSCHFTPFSLSQGCRAISQLAVKIWMEVMHVMSSMLTLIKFFRVKFR